MNETKNLLELFKTRKAHWSDYAEFLELNENELMPFFNLALEITRKEFKNLLKIYIPNKRFPALSITGNECALGCEHCNKKYLDNMKPILNNSELEEYLLKLADSGGVGILLSGGCDSEGSIPILNFLDTIKKIKNQTKLIINTHTGLLNEETASKLAEANVDIVSFDINMDEEVVRDIYHLEKGLNEYKKGIEILKKYNLTIVPHICIGIHYGKIHKELESLKFIKDSGINPSLIVLIALIPPKHSIIKFEQPKPLDIAKIVTLTRIIFPTTEISLGCMRPRGRNKNDIEIAAIKAGITRIEIPSPKTLKKIKKENPNLKFKFISACCAIPEKFEELALSEKADIRRYQIF